MPHNEVLHLVGTTLFAWDREKASNNLAKHGVSFIEAATAFLDSGAILLADPDHSQEEDRFVLIGYTSMQKLLTVVHIERGNTLRIISAWPATRRERRVYEKKGKT